MEDVEERRRRLAAMREQADAQRDGGTVSSVPSLTAPLLSNPLSEDSSDTAAAEVKSSNFDFYTDPLAGYSGSKRRKPGVGLLPKPSQAPLSSNAGILPHPPHLQAAGVYPPPGPPSWQPVSYQTTYVNPAFAHPQPTAQFQPQFPPRHVNQWANQASGRGRGRGGDRGFGGRSSGRQSLNSPAGDAWRDGNRSEGRGAHGRGYGRGRIVSAKEQPHLFAKKSMLEDPWQGLEANRTERPEER